MSFRANADKAGVVIRVPRFQQAAWRSRYRVLADAIKPLIEVLESRQLLSTTGLGVNFTGGGNGPAVTMASTDTAGVFPIANYNNEAGGTQTGVALTDATGAASPVTLTYTSGGTWNSINGTNVPPATGDQELNNGFVFTNGTTPADFQLSGIPYANYDVYVYELNDGANRIETTTDINTGASVVGSSPNPGDANHESGTVNNYQYIAATGTAAAPTPNADFAVFSGSTANFEFQAFAPGNGYINGFEIVDHTTTAPTLTAATPGNGAVGLSWTYGNAQSNNFTYTIFRSDPSHPAAAIATGVNAQTYNDTTAANNTTYTYYVVANNGVGPSANSNSLSATPVAGPPPAPTGIAASRTNATTVAVSWNAALGAASYDVQRGTSLNSNGTLGGTITDITPGGTTQTSVNDTGALPSGYYAVTAKNTAGTSPASLAVFVNNGDGWQASYYSSDTANTVVYDGDQTATVAYTQPDGTPVPTTIPQPAAANSPPVNNAVLGFQRNENTPINDVGFNNTNLPPNAPSNFNSIEGAATPGQDFAVRWVGYIEAPYTGYYTLNPNSDDGVATTVFDTTHLTNGLPTPVTLQPDNIFLGRGPNTDSDPVVDSTGAPVQWIAGQKYLVQMDYQQQGGGWQAILSYEVSSTAALRTSGTYDIQSQKVIPVSQVVAPVPTFQTVDAANPTGLAKDSSYYTISALAGTNSVQLTFSNIGADSYNIYRSTSPTGPFTTPIANIPETNGQAVVFNDTAGLTNGTKYYYVVTGVDAMGETPIASGLTTSATPVSAAPAAPTNLTATRLDANHVALTWSPSNFATSYDVRRGTVLNADGTLGGTVVDVTQGGTTQTSFTDANAFQRTTYYYQVTASNAGGTSAPSNTATVTATFSIGGTPNAISVNFTGGGNGGSPAVSMLPTDSAGVVPEANYNNENGGSGTGIALNDGTGASSGATLTYTSGGTWASVGGTTFTPANGDQKLNDGFLFSAGATPMDFQLTGIPFANYDVYIFELNDGGGRLETTIDVNTGVTVYGTSANPTDANHESGVANTYQYIAATSTNNTAPTPNADYVMFSNNTPNFEFQAFSAANGYLNGFEIVNHPTTAPTAAPVLNPATAGNGTVALTWSSVPNASTYTVYRSDPGHPTPVIVATNIPTTAYTDNSVTNGVTYTYTVSGDDTVGAGPLSNAVSATPTAPSLPPYITASSGAVFNYNSTTGALSLTSGTLTFTADNTTAPLANLTASGSASGVFFNTNEHLAGLTLTGGAQATMLSLGAARTHSNHDVLVIGTLGSTNDPAFSIDSQSKLNLEDNDLIVHTGSSDHGNGTPDVVGVPETNALINVQALAALGRHVPAGSVLNGTWNGNGLASSSAASVDSSAGFEQNVLAVVQNSDQILGSLSKWTVGSFSENLGSNDIIVKYTYNGDAALEGKVLDNSVTIVNGFYDAGKSTQADWAFGSFTGNGKVDDNDITILNGLYGLGTGGANGPLL